MTHISDLLISGGLLVARVVLGVFFACAGYRKLTLTQEQWANMCEHLHLTNWEKKVIPVAQILGGIALTLGFLTSWAAFGLLVILGGAFKLTCVPNICGQKPKELSGWIMTACMEPETCMIIVLFLITPTGGGLFALDNIVWRLL